MGRVMKDAPFLKTIAGEKTDRPPVWLMRQAGRYLSEYRATREKAGSFLDLCYNPELAEEVTLQPIRRFGFDAAILFSDILVIPHALGQDVSFIKGQGPVLKPLKGLTDIESLERDMVLERLQPVFETVSRLSRSLPSQTALIGFCGAPFTVATYMIAGEGSKDQAVTREFAYQNPKAFQKLINLLVDVSTDYLSAQIEAGAETVKIFDSWAGALAETEMMKWSFEPLKEMTRRLKARHPDVPVILFPRGVGVSYKLFALEAGADVMAFDFSLPLSFVQKEIYPHVAVQGGLDPLLLVAGGEALDAAVERFIGAFPDGRYIFNLGHGIVPHTPVEHVSRLLNIIRKPQS